MNVVDAIGRDPERMSGELCFKGTRVPVKALFDHLAYGEWEGFQAGFPGIPEEGVRAVVQEAYRLFEEKYGAASMAAA